MLMHLPVRCCISSELVAILVHDTMVVLDIDSAYYYNDIYQGMTIELIHNEEIRQLEEKLGNVVYFGDTLHPSVIDMLKATEACPFIYTSPTKYDIGYPSPK
jgi:hypothetical protein